MGINFGRKRPLARSGRRWEDNISMLFEGKLDERTQIAVIWLGIRRNWCDDNCFIASGSVKCLEFLEKVRNDKLRKMDRAGRN